MQSVLNWGKFVFKCRINSHINTDFCKHIFCTLYWLQLWLSQVNLAGKVYRIYFKQLGVNM